MLGCSILQIKIPKTASSSIEKGIASLCKIKGVSKTKSFGHLNPKKEEYPRCYFLASVRNPYDKLLSAYRYIIENKADKPEHQYIFDFGSFENFTLSLPDFAYKNRFFYPQVNWLLHNKKPNYDFIIRYETLEKDWNDFTAQYTKKTINLPHIRPSTHKPWNQMYTQKMKDVVYDFYKRDFLLLNYPQ